MGEILGAGTTHYPGFLYPPEAMHEAVVRATKNPRAPEEWREPSGWPAPLREEFGEDNGVSAGVKHRAKVMDAFHQIRDAIDAFAPDFVLIFGDDQWENFHDDLVPPFAVYAWDEIECQPFMRRAYVGDGENAWREPRDTVFRFKGHREAGVHLVNELMNQDFDIAYSYRPLHATGLAHAHLNTLLYLDDDRRGWSYPVLPVHINCHGDRFVRNHAVGGPTNTELPPDPQGPSPRRCFELGRAVARALVDSPWRVVMIGSASWSHGSLTAKHSWVYPDVEADQRLFERLAANDLTYFRDITAEELAEAGQLEVRDWCAVVGAMYELGRQVEVVDFSNSYIFNSSKCAVLFPSDSRETAGSVGG